MSTNPTATVPVNKPMKKIGRWYWIATVIFSLLMILDGIGGLTMQQEGIDAMHQLGYAPHIMLIVGTAKILGAAGLLQQRFMVLKEWAFAGFAFNFIGASASWALAGGNWGAVGFPLIFLLLMIIPYRLWKKYESLKVS